MTTTPAVQPRTTPLPWALVARTQLLILLAGLILGGLWRLLAPIAQVRQTENDFVLIGSQEVMVAQDGWLAAILACAGIGLAAWQGLRGREPSVIPALVAAGGLGLAGVLAWQFGQILGPDDLPSQAAAGLVQFQTPLRLQTASVLLVGPLLFCATRSLTAFLTDGPANSNLDK